MRLAPLRVRETSVSITLGHPWATKAPAGQSGVIGSRRPPGGFPHLLRQVGGWTEEEVFQSEVGDAVPVPREGVEGDEVARIAVA